MDIVGSALRLDFGRGIRGSPAEVVLSIRRDSEVGGVAIQADLCTCFESMGFGGDRNVFARLKEIAKCPCYRASRSVEGLKERIVKLDRGVRQICRRERRRRSCRA